MAPQETHHTPQLPQEQNDLPTVVLHVFGNPALEMTKNMGILHARNQAKAGYDVGFPLVHRYALVHPGGFWTFPQDLSDLELNKGPKLNLSLAIQKISELQVTMAVIHVHTTDCNYKTLFELLDIPFIGSGGEESANVADKATTRALLLQAGVKVPHGTVLSKEMFTSNEFSTEDLMMANSLSFPLVVKPNRMEASVGVVLVHNKQEMVAALNTAFSYGNCAIIDTFIVGREIRAGVLSRNQGPLEKLPLMEYAISHDDIRRMDSKVEKDGKTLINLPNSFKYIQEEEDPSLHKAMHEVACRAHTALSCRDFSFIDCRVTESGEVYVLEINVFAAFNPGSVMSKLTSAGGITHQEFWTAMVENALGRAKPRHKMGA